MSGPAGATRVFPSDPPAAPPSSGAGGGHGLGGLRKVDKKVWAGIGAVIVAGVALIVGSRGPSDGSGVAGDDTTATDLYDELQPELEGIGTSLDDINQQLDDQNQQDQLGDNPSAQPPAPAKAGRPHKHRPSPKPDKPKGQHSHGRPGHWTPGPGSTGGKGGKSGRSTAGSGPRRPAAPPHAPAPRPAPQPQPRPARGKKK